MHLPNLFRPASQHELLDEAVEFGLDLRLGVEADPQHVAHDEVAVVAHRARRRLRGLREERLP